MSAPLFPLLPAIAAGFRHVAKDWPFLSALIAFPIMVTFLIILGLDVTGYGASMVWSAVFKVPADFIQGIFLALYVRYILFADTPTKLAGNLEHQRAVAVSAILFTALNFILSGIYAAMMPIMTESSAAMQNNVPPTTETLLIVLAGLLLTIWLFRYQFLPVAAAAGYNARAFIRFLGAGFSLPIRIMAVWFITALPAVFIMGLAGEALVAMGGFDNMTELKGPPAWLFYLLNATVSVVTSAVQTAAAVYAIRHGMKGQTRHV